MSAAEHLREAIDIGCTRDDHDHIADHRAEVLAEVTTLFDDRGLALDGGIMTAYDAAELVRRHAGGKDAGVAAEPTTASPWPTISRLVQWLDEKNGRDQQETLLRLFKIQEEAGEVAQAVIGATGQNPRKGASHTWDDVADELCDVIVTAMVALATICGDPEEHFERKLAQIAKLRVDGGEAATVTAPDFFQPDQTYTRRDGTTFQCFTVTTTPWNGRPLAVGWHTDADDITSISWRGIGEWRGEYNGGDR